MKPLPLSLCLALGTIMLGWPPPASAAPAAVPVRKPDPHVTAFEDHPTRLYVITIRSGVATRDTLLFDLEHSQVLYFNDRPSRRAGYLPIQAFLSLWKSGGDSFKADPPNATLSIVGAPDPSVVIELGQPTLQTGKLSLPYRVLEGRMPGRFQQAFLFVDGYWPLIHEGD